MATVSRLVSLSDYLKFQAPGRAKDELIEGEIVVSPSAKPNHAILSKHLVRLLDDLLENSGFEINADLSIVLDTNNPASMPRPDVFVMERTRFLAAANRDAFPEGSPELAIEIVSPSNTKSELSAKVRLYLRHGSSRRLGDLSEDEDPDGLGG